jgi:pimeloyl-ACP methyl ester carboxylesterase
MWTHARLMTALGVAGLLVASWPAAAQSSAEATPASTSAPAAPSASTPVPPDAQAQALRQQADRLIASASERADALIKWFSETGTKATDGAQSARQSAEAWLRAQVEAALSKPAPPVGVRWLVPASGGIEAGVEWSGATPKPLTATRVVLLVHGLDESGPIWDDLAPRVRAMASAQKPLAVARFDYPNDQSVALSADALGAALAELRAAGVERVDLVAHSMGGLVVRDVLTRSAFYAGRADAGAGGLPVVERVILIATPNQGSAMARLWPVSELREQVVRWAAGDLADVRTLLGFLKDGGGQAAEDLLPGSAFLTELNARPMPVGAIFTVIAGSAAEGLDRDIEQLLQWNGLKSVLSPEQIEHARRAVLEAAGALGDGVVSADSQMLPGVEDTVVIRANHRLMLKRPTLEHEVREALGEPDKLGSAVPIVLDRLAR